MTLAEGCPIPGEFSWVLMHAATASSTSTKNTKPHRPTARRFNSSLTPSFFSDFPIQFSSSERFYGTMPNLFWDGVRVLGPWNRSELDRLFTCVRGASAPFQKRRTIAVFRFVVNPNTRILLPVHRATSPLPLIPGSPTDSSSTSLRADRPK